MVFVFFPIIFPSYLSAGVTPWHFHKHVRVIFFFFFLIIPSICIGGFFINLKLVSGSVWPYKRVFISVRVLSKCMGYTRRSPFQIFLEFMLSAFWPSVNMP